MHIDNDASNDDGGDDGDGGGGGGSCGDIMLYTDEGETAAGL